jgi:hypothetical protein
MAGHYTLTTDQLATALNITPDEAYLLIRLGETRGHVKKVGTAMPKPGKRGKGPNLYRIDIAFPDHIMSLWRDAVDAGRLEIFGEEKTE